MIQTSEGNLPQGLDAAIRTGLERGRRTVARRARVRRGAVRSALCLALVLGLAACGSTTPEVPKDDPQTPAETPTQDSVTPDEPQTGKTLVVYYSASGHTRQVAQAIAQAAELNKGV